MTSLLDNPSFFFAEARQDRSGGGTRCDTGGVLRSGAGRRSEQHAAVHAACPLALAEAAACDRARRMIPDRPCPRFEAWMAAIDPARVTLIFPAAYLNNPSSMFGHTLIRIDPAQRPDAPPLNATTVHFAADHQGESGALFAIKGLAGGYRGYFSVLRYYEKVTQYSDIENRDIWEYELDIASGENPPDDGALWEVDMQPIDYYFLSTNCSFVLLSLAQRRAARLAADRGFPGLRHPGRYRACGCRCARHPAPRHLPTVAALAHRRSLDAAQCRRAEPGAGAGRR